MDTLTIACINIKDDQIKKYLIPFIWTFRQSFSVLYLFTFIYSDIWQSHIFSFVFYILFIHLFAKQHKHIDYVWWYMQKNDPNTFSQKNKSKLFLCLKWSWLLLKSVQIFCTIFVLNQSKACLKAQIITNVINSFWSWGMEAHSRSRCWSVFIYDFWT